MLLTNINMELYIADDIKRKAHQCKHNYICLIKSKEKICKVISSINDDVIHLYCLKEGNCAYREEVKERVICNCPVRKEIYRQYRF